MGEVTLTGDSSVRIQENSHIVLDNGSTVEVKGTPAHPFYIRELQNIAPIAAHIKELNHIDPISVESLFVSQVRNVEPLAIEKFNVTNLPLVNVALRQVPPVEVNVGRLPAISVGTHQVFELPSHYTVRARILGFELLRIQLCGKTRIAATETFRREQERAGSRSFPVVATAGNPAIPSKIRETGGYYSGCPPCSGPRSRHAGGLRAGAHLQGIRLSGAKR
jgi:hypothetical protein